RLHGAPGTTEQVGLPAGIETCQVEGQRAPTAPAAVAAQCRQVRRAQLEHVGFGAEFGQGIGPGAAQAGPRLAQAGGSAGDVRAVAQSLIDQLVQ
nr:hypothetical protein [Tanacetum cinerariifolium]